ncbi:iron ABC transporter permease [Curtobacterium sp. MCPF17_002]|uniref:FecCD family ABC transporter permease n=1 Tax=Curtobacterium sp. MCPF17_002 TaxID=2175645 RepID=UPI0021AC5928|nr:iron ABC transporter permease [Curtobacterium sp. MCPF17_002]WIB76747.1 iron ABC transporter permease [Curtobacterium sp. MCPF17_002]
MPAPSAALVSAPDARATDPIAALGVHRAAIRRRVLVITGLVVALAVVAVASMLLGSNRIGVDQVLAGLMRTGSSTDEAIVWGSRIPRTLIGASVGAALGIAGLLMQGHTRNPLADPGLFGVSSGAGLAVVIGVYVFGVTGTGATVWFALVGALVASVVVFSVTIAGSGTASPVPLALAGAAVSALLGALTSFVVLTDQDSLDAYRLWVVGSLAARQLDVLGAVWPFLVAGLLLAVLNVRALDALGLGTELAKGLGENVLVARLVGLGGITLLAAGATAAAGPIGFVGLTVPHVARALVGTGHRWTLPVSALVGAALVLLADVIGRLIGGFSEVEVGIVLAVIGGPVFVAVARRRSLVSL